MSPRRIRVKRGHLRKPRSRFQLMNRFTLVFLLLISPTPALQDSSNHSEPASDHDSFLYLVGRKKLLDAQYKCYDRIQEMPPYDGEGPYCNRTWDGWLCWDDTPAGVTVYQHCPDYFPDFDTTEKVSKYCDENGEWFKHPDSNRTWSNYTLCNAFTSEKLNSAYVLYYLALVGHSLSIAALVASMGIFLFFKNLRCQRVTLHKNMFMTYILNSIIIIIHLVEVVPNGDLVRRDPMHIFHHNTHMWTMQWELSPPLPLSAKEGKMDPNDSEVVNFFFLLNIVRVLVTKMRQTHEAETYLYLKAVKATMVLVPLLGIQFVVFPWRPSNKILGRIYDYVMHFLIHFQGFFVATIYCFCNHEVQVALKRQWAKLKIRWSQRWGRRRRRRNNNRVVAAPRALAFAETGGLPIYICHQEPRNAPINNNQGEEGVEMIPMNVIQQDPSVPQED